MNDQHVEDLINKYGFQDYKWIDSKEIVVKQWVRFKCLFMCDTYGTKAVCPPNMPTVQECEKFFSEYSKAVILRIQVPAYHGDKDSEVFREIDKNLIELEKEIFYAGYYKVMAFLATICYQCQDCPREMTDCVYKQWSRPTPEALGVDVFETVKKVGYPIEVLSNYQQQMNRYAIIMIE
ncbi:DUF2284 domain-containing protein [Natranaerobius thermophilus]|uniref:Metal-binding protein n=1 Tax=Natranaerobius thermophilus (strain ATCC BAA-1301 / DSM 18059 / JW/NM-WN-LF) TaxID=457570 RepID=B2A7M6_NATTJ|nr:DUF2284 domain-containing protein [Natranaerobius thermophilus]ACB85735.1 conserved hypothetical protein [Natranaerobius thermophilus JW/NM-WN-LF]